MEMLDPDARAYLKSMLEHQIEEKYKANAANKTPGNKMATQVK